MDVVCLITQGTFMLQTCSMLVLVMLVTGDDDGPSMTQDLSQRHSGEDVSTSYYYPVRVAVTLLLAGENI